MKKFFRYILIFFAIILLLVVGLFFAIQIPSVQSKIISKVVEKVNQDFGTSISVGGVDIDFWGDIVLSDISAKDYKQNDFIDIKKVTADISLWDIYHDSNNVAVKSLVLDQARVKVLTYKGDSVSNFMRFLDVFATGDTTESHFKLRGNIEINESALSIINDNLDEKSRVWLDATQLNGLVKGFKMHDDIYEADIRNLSFLAKKNGENFELKKLASKFKMDNTGFYFDDLTFNTESSFLQGHIRLLTPTENAFSDFSNKVDWDLELGKDNVLGFKDIRYFVPDWDSSEEIQISGKATGSLNNLNLAELNLANGKTKIKTPVINLQNMIDGDIGVFSNELNVSTSYDELVRILPTFIDKNITPYIKRFGDMDYGGAFNLDDQLVYAKGNLQSALGQAFVNLNMYDYRKENPTYNGFINTPNFDLRQLTEMKMLDKVSGEIDFKGESFDINKMTLTAKGKINYLDLMGERYNNISLDGVLNKSTYKGFLSINDPGKAQLDYQGFFDFSQKEIKADFKSNVSYVNLNYFKLTDKRNSWIKATVEGNARFSDINDLQGDFVMDQITFNSDTLLVNLPKTDLSFSKTPNGEKLIDLQMPNYLTATMEGQFNIDELGDIMQNGVGNFLVDYKKKKVSKGQHLNYLVIVEDDLINYFLPNLRVKPQTLAAGVIDNDNDVFQVDFRSPSIRYKDYMAQDIHLAAAAGEQKTIELTSEKLKIENILFSSLRLDGKTENDTLNAKMHFFAGEQKATEFNLNFYQTFDDEHKIKVGFSPSKFNLEGVEWHINPENSTESNYASIDFDKNIYKVSDFVLQSDNQYLKINGDYFNPEKFNFQAEIENILLEKAIPKSYMTGMNLKGIANGTIDIKKDNNQVEPIADLKIDSIKLDNRLIGNFTTETKYDVDAQTFNIIGSLDKFNNNTLFVSGDIKNTNSEPELDLVANFDDFDVDILGVFLDEVMTDWKGKLSGDVVLKGKLMDPSISGEVTMKDLGFRVVYLGTRYQFNGENELVLNKQPGFNGQLELDNVTFTETTSKTKGVVDGSLIFSDLSSWFLDLDFKTDKLLVINTSVKDNEMFYGRVLAKGEFFMFGPASDLVVSGRNLKVLPGSVINLNTSSTKNVGENRFIQFYSVDEAGNLVQDEKQEQRVSGFSMDLRLNVDAGTTVNLVLDEKSDDKIEAQGHAKNFKIAMNRAGNLSIDGEYIITDGVYNYRQSVIIDKKFDIEKGGYIRFNGNPYNAQMSLRAIYSRSVSNTGAYLGATYLQPTLVDVVASINGDLKKTNIDLGIEIPDANSQIQSMLDSKIKGNVDERIRQVGSILVLGRFDVNESITTSTATDAAASSAFELLGRQVGNAFSSIIPGLEINPTYLQASDSRNQADRIQTQFNLAINPRLKINGAVGTPLGSQFNEEVTTSLELDYDISKRLDGGLRLRAFSRPSTIGLENYNVNNTYAQSYGAGIVYHRAFNKFRELFAKKTDEEKEKKNEKDKKTNKAVIDSANRQKKKTIQFEEKDK
uniref:translocation/assembly module TamB domain-containing protein n=1 Tax=Ornithobacterium rhinotracheale TaxID=28251 RepID=UPI00129D1136|nr:hypothetical protein [Ornithobacterium rhinotracheale]